VKLISDGNDLYGATSTASIYFSSDNGLNCESLPLHPDIFPYGVDLFIFCISAVFESMSLS